MCNMNNKRKKNTFLSFKIGNETFAVSVHKALEVLEKQHITVVPNVPEYVNGVINFRGKIIPVIDVRLKLNLLKRSADAKYVIIVMDINIENRKMIIGCLVDSVQNVVALDDEEILNVPELGFNYNTEFIKGMFKEKNGFIIILNIDNVFKMEETEIRINESEEVILS